MEHNGNSSDIGTIVAPLGNIESPSKLIINEKLYLEPIPRHMSPIIKRARDSYMIHHPPAYTHCLVLKSIDLSNSGEVGFRRDLEDIVLLLRLYKPGNVYYNYALIDKNNWYENPMRSQAIGMKEFAVFYYMGWPQKGVDQIFKLTKDDFRSLKVFVNKNIGKTILRTRPFRYFFRGFHEPQVDDRFLDNVIGLENILAGDTKDQSNIRYKFIDRGCFLLANVIPYEGDPNIYAKPLRDIYDTRCEIVHFSKYERDWHSDESVELVKNSDLFLRRILRLILEDEEFLNCEKVDKRKRKAFRQTRV